MLSSLAYLGPELRTSKPSKQTAKAVELSKQFSNLLKNNDLYRGLFQMAVCCSWEEVHNSLQALIGYAENRQEDGQGAPTDPGSSSGSAGQQKPRPRIGKCYQGRLCVYVSGVFE